MSRTTRLRVGAVYPSTITVQVQCPRCDDAMSVEVTLDGEHTSHDAPPHCAHHVPSPLDGRYSVGETKRLTQSITDATARLLEEEAS